MIICIHCNSLDYVKKGFSDTGKQRYICKNCNKQFTVDYERTVYSSPVLRNCLNCNKETSNPKFCGRSCSASYNNKTIHYKHGFNIKKICRECGVNYTSKSYTGLCRQCFLSIPKTSFYRNFLSKTINDVLFANKLFRETTEVRRIARELWQRLNYPKHCEVCGYDKHYEICHLQAISSFSLDTKIRTVNAPANLVALCPNCHWEFDNNKMAYEHMRMVIDAAESRNKPYIKTIEVFEPFNFS